MFNLFSVMFESAALSNIMRDEGWNAKHLLLCVALIKDNEFLILIVGEIWMSFTE